MTVYAVLVVSGDDSFVHGVYRSRVTASLVAERLREQPYIDAVRINTRQLRLFGERLVRRIVAPRGK